MLDSNFCFLDEEIPYVKWDAKYATSDNFTGKPVDGYSINRIVGTKDLANALLKVSKKAESLGYGLFLWDGYRPQRAVENFCEWVKHGSDRRKAQNYPNIDRKNMIKEGYIAEKSGHSRGSTIDLTLYKLGTEKLLDMGGDFDYMDEKSHYNSKNVGENAILNRKFLRALMEYGGFKPLEWEWWHYTLENEPYPDTYFDFAIE